MAGSVFISYRREDTAPYARLIFERFGKRIGENHVFMDVHTMKPGDKFKQIIEDKVSKCDVLLALIGRGWLSASDQNGRRLDNDSDWVRQEITEALKRGIRVIPVLLDDARMPQARDLPEDLAGLARRNAYPIRHESFNNDVDHLIDFVVSELSNDEVLIGPPLRKVYSEAKTRPARRKSLLYLGTAAAIIVLALLYVIFKGQTFVPAPPPAPSDVSHDGGRLGESGTSVPKKKLPSKETAPYSPEKGKPVNLPDGRSEKAHGSGPETVRSGKGQKGCATAKRYARYAAETLKQLEHRVRALEKAVKLCPQDPALRVALARLHETAATDLFRLIETAEEPQRTFQEVVDVYNRITDKATRQFKEALSHDGSNYEALVGLGRIAATRGQYGQALKYFRKAMAIRPEDPIQTIQTVEIAAQKEKKASELLTAEEIVKELSQGTRSGGRNSVSGTMAPSIADNVTRFLVAGRKRVASILFDQWSMELNKPETIDQLNQIGNALASKGLKDYRAIIEVHSGTPGGFERNVGLSWDRGRAIRDYLVSKFGISPSRLSVQGFGSSRPLISENSPEARRKNDRVEIIFLPDRPEARPRRPESSVERENIAAADPKTKQATGRLFALCVGISRYSDSSIPPLKFCSKDASDLGTFLESQNGLFRSVAVKILINESATLHNIRSSVFDMLRKSQRGDTVILFLGGHSATDPEDPEAFYFLPYDVSPKYLQGTALNLSRLDFLRRIGEQKVIIFSELTGSSGYGSPSQAHRRKPFQNLMSNLSSADAVPKNIAMIGTSSGSDELPLEMDTYPNSPFTHNLLEALKGGAERDKNGVITLGAVQRFLTQRPRKAAGRNAHFVVVGEGLDSLPLALSD